MREPVDRELVVAALAGIYTRGQPDLGLFIRLYQISDQEAKRAFRVAIRQLMQKGNWKPAFDRIRSLAEAEIEQFAWEVVGGGLQEVNGRDRTLAMATVARVLRAFLFRSIPQGPVFDLTGSFKAFTPEVDPDYPTHIQGEVVSDLILGEFNRSKEVFDSLSPSIQQLYLDAGVRIADNE